MIEEKKDSDEQNAATPETGLTLEELRNILGVTITESPRQFLDRQQETRVAKYLEATEPSYVPPVAFSYDSQEQAVDKASEFLQQEKNNKKLFKKAISYLSKYVAQRSLTKALKHHTGNDARQQAGELMTHLEYSGSPFLYRSSPGSGRRGQFDKIDYSSFELPKVAELLTQLEQPVETIKKMEQLCGNQWETLLKYHAGEMIPVLQIVEKTPDTVIESISEVLRENRVVSISTHPEGGRSNNNIYHSDLDIVAQACQQGGFTGEQLEQLDTFRRLVRLVPGRYINLPLARVSEEYSQAKKELTVAEKILGSYYGADVQEMTTFGTGHLVTRKPGPDQFKQLFDAVISGTDSFGSEFIELVDDHNVELDPNLFEDMARRVVRTHGPRSGTYGRRIQPPPAKTAEELENFTSPAKLEVVRHKRLVLNQENSIQNPRLEFARTIAIAEGVPFNSGNVSEYLYIDKILDQVYQQITQFDDDERLHFYKELVLSDKHSDSFWKKISKDLSSNTMDEKYAEKMKTRLLRLLGDHIFFSDGQVDQPLVIRAYEEEYCQDERLLKYLPAEQQPYFTFLIGLPYELRPILKQHRAEFKQLVLSGKETPQLMKLLLQGTPSQIAFLEFLSKEKLALTFGAEAAEKFLSSLPKKTDERRNAFTHNEYDRTSGLMEYFIKDPSSKFDLTTDLPTLTEFVAEFGLSRSPSIFRMYKLAKLHQTGQLTEKPEELAESGIESTDQLLKEVKELKGSVMSIEPLNADKLKKFSPFQLQLLKVIVGKTTHRFDFGRPDFDRIVADFIRSEENNEITPLEDGYEQARFEMTKVTIEFDAAPISADFEVIRNEVLDSIQNVEQHADLVSELTEIILDKISSARQALENIPVEKRSYAEKNIRDLEALQDKLSQPLSQDQLLVVMLNLNLGKAEFAKENSLKRRLILRKVFAKHFSAAFIQDVQMNLSGDITPTAILTVLNIVDELVKQHALNLGNEQSQGAQKYWTPETVDALKGSKNGKKLYEVFGGLRDKLKNAVDDFTVKEGSGKTVIDAIPSRDFTGEVSGYIADVCYTKEYPLLKNRPVTPYKFVLAGETAEQGELAGSVLIFEVTNDAGEDCLLVRGFDYRNEEQVNIPQFIEKFLDQMEDVAKKRNKKHVLIPGATGAISNYPMTINHLTQTYISGKEAISLNEVFRFNDYDLTHSCFVARTVTE